MLAGALLGAWLVLHNGLGRPLLISAVSVAATPLALLRIPARSPATRERTVDRRRRSKLRRRKAFTSTAPQPS
ncbi:hypothetical protein SSP24_83270 [Streptomyces spinoverrucosus]|uniref:Uncharacterized protein n=1 Tax=Streptomyces spinoverrucosus TaxID=284043 RepID=A0A4Y3VUM4_9ACTN|nr:hypothetical protein [Streptomyces spinoverrucosus]GEC10672.1 hypothetical protein SSP24_83270 [Streptomyces spinoverrucosus]GHB99392.1 hypothetical protein GCM10010397_84520 [Streptomyces spinoverrucosus]